MLCPTGTGTYQIKSLDFASGLHHQGDWEGNAQGRVCTDILNNTAVYLNLHHEQLPLELFLDEANLPDWFWRHLPYKESREHPQQAQKDVVEGDCAEYDDTLLLELQNKGQFKIRVCPNGPEDCGPPIILCSRDYPPALM